MQVERHGLVISENYYLVMVLDMFGYHKMLEMKKILYNCSKHELKIVTFNYGNLNSPKALHYRFYKSDLFSEPYLDINLPFVLRKLCQIFVVQRMTL